MTASGDISASGHLTVGGNTKLFSDSAVIAPAKLYFGNSNVLTNASGLHVYSEGVATDENQIILCKTNKLRILNQSHGKDIEFGTENSGGTAKTPLTLKGDGQAVFGGNVTASGNISASGGGSILGGNVTIGDACTDTLTIDSNVVVNCKITSSGNIIVTGSATFVGDGSGLTSLPGATITQNDADTTTFLTFVANNPDGSQQSLLGDNQLTYDASNNILGVIGHVTASQTVATGTVSASIITGFSGKDLDIKSSGSGADSLKIYTEQGSIDIDSVDNITIDAVDDIALSTTSADGLLSLVSAHTAGQAFHLDANANAGSIVDIDAGILDIDCAGTASITATATHIENDVTLGNDCADDINILGTITASCAFSSSGAIMTSTTITALGNVDFDGDLDVDGTTNVDNIDIDGTLTMDGAGFSLDSAGAASNLTVASDDAGDDLTISVTGATDSSVLISSTGTGTDAVSIDATAGDMLIGPSLADGKTLKLGKNGAVEAVFAPHGTAGSEVFTLTNTAGTSHEAIQFLASAGGVHMRATTGITLTGTVTCSNSLAVATDLFHSGDPDTKIGFDTDDITITVGGEQMLKFTEDDSQDKIIFGDGGDIDFEFAGTGVLKFTTDNTDHAIQQHDGTEIARIHDGGSSQASGMTAVSPGFGFKRPVMSITADSGDATVTLSEDDSGAIIHLDADTNNIIINLPVVDATTKIGTEFTFVTTTAVHGSKTILINTSGTDGNDNFLLHNHGKNLQDHSGDTILIPSAAPIGTAVRVTCLASGGSNAAELWLAEAFGANIGITNT
jgi:hypothetical protein